MRWLLCVFFIFAAEVHAGCTQYYVSAPKLGQMKVVATGVEAVAAYDYWYYTFVSTIEISCDYEENDYFLTFTDMHNLADIGTAVVAAAQSGVVELNPLPATAISAGPAGWVLLFVVKKLSSILYPRYPWRQCVELTKNLAITLVGATVVNVVAATGGAAGIALVGGVAAGGAYSQTDYVINEAASECLVPSPWPAGELPDFTAVTSK